METIQKIIISSAPMNEIKNFLNGISNKSSGYKYFCDDCEISIGRTWVEKKGSLNIQLTEVAFFGSEGSVNRYMKVFRLKFLSAGG